MPEYTTDRRLGQIEAQLTVAAHLCSTLEMVFGHVGHDDSKAEIAAIEVQLRRLRKTTQDRLGTG